MLTNTAWLLYGATGRTGTLIAEEAVARGHRPVLAGRDADRVRQLAERLDLQWVAGETTEIAGLLGDARLVLLAAGPFSATAPAVLEACLNAGVHYLDIANEIPIATAALAADRAAQDRGISVVPAVGFGTVASDGLARYVTDQVPGADQLDLAILLETDGTSAGARTSRMGALASGGAIRRDGRLISTRLGTGARRQHTPVGDRTLVPAPTADLVVSAHTTGVPNITVSFPVRMPPVAAKLSMPVLPLLAKASSRRSPRAEASRSNGEQPPPDSYLWARASAADGQVAEAWLRTGEGYAYTARAAVLSIEAVLGAPPHGATTVTRAFGPELSFQAGGELVASA